MLAPLVLLQKSNSSRYIPHQEGGTGKDRLFRLPFTKGYSVTHSNLTDQLPSLAPDERIDEVNEHIRLIQKKDGLTYGTDAFLLSAFAPTHPRARAVDLGSGTGIIPLLLTAKRKVREVFAVELQPAFCDLIARNAALNDATEHIHPLCKDVRELSPDDVGGEVDLVLSNPPYMTVDSGKRNLSDAKYIARHETAGGIADFCAAAARLLRYGGKFLTVWRPDRLAELFSALHAAGLAPKRIVFVHSDQYSEPSMILLESVRGGAPAMRVSRPLLLSLPLQEGERTRRSTEDALEIYRSCSFDSFCSNEILSKKEKTQ